MAQEVMVGGIPDLDANLYRIFPLWYFEDMLVAQRLVLVRPRIWEDPYEDIFEIMAAQEPAGEQRMLVNYLDPAYAQCWSLEGDSDVLMRAYSRVVKDPSTSRNTDPRNEGVLVQTTPRKLVSAVNQWINERPHLNWRFYLAAIEYRDDFENHLADLLRTIGPKKLGGGNERVQSLLFKRKAFSHEVEVRLICVTDNATKDTMISINVKPNEVLSNVQFDPRLASFERVERETFAKQKGYTGRIITNSRYQKTLFNVMMTDTCDNLDSKR